MGSDAGTAGKSTSGGSVDEQTIAAAVPPASSPSAHYLVRTGDLSLLIARGTLLPTVDRVRSMTTAMGGYVMSSAVGGGQPQVTATIEPMPLGDQVVSSDDGAQGMPVTLEDPYASLVVRVPEQLFDTALKRFSKLGEVRSVSTSSEDVTSQYVDLRARLRHFRAVERRLIGFLDETTTVNQMLAIQDRIDQVQLTIEELTAQLKSLRETTSYGTLSVFLSEKNATPAAVHASNTFGGTFWNSMRLLGHGARVTGLVLHRAGALPRRLRRDRPRRVVRGPARTPQPQAGGAADPAGLTGPDRPAARPRLLRRRPRPGSSAHTGAHPASSGEPRPRAG